MFTGVVRHQGTVVRVARRGGGSTLEIETVLSGGLGVGDSIAVNGVCVTVTARRERGFMCDLVPETIARSNLGTLQPGDEVNLEMPLRAGDRLDGHLVQGHVDAVGMVRSRRRVGAQDVLEVNVPFELTRYLAAKGSVSLDGVSLTIVDVGKDRFRVALIPHTVAATTLGKKVQGATLNVEADVLSKYVERHLAARLPARVPSLLGDLPGMRPVPRPVSLPTPRSSPALRPSPAPRLSATPRSSPARAPAKPRPKPRPKPKPKPEPKPRPKQKPKPRQGSARKAKGNVRKARSRR